MDSVSSATPPAGRAARPVHTVDRAAVDELPMPSADGVEHRFIDIGGARMHVAEAGAGPPLVLLHGWPQHWFSSRHVLPTLEQHHRVICPDIRGLGWSEGPGTDWS